jgi:CheY-like chemotaxis protein
MPDAPGVESSRRVLIVDDNRDAADSLAMCLQLDGHAAKAVYSAEGALEQLDMFAPEVVLLDIGLPRMNGYQVAQRIRAAGSSIKMIALTGYGQEEDKERTHAAGFNAHFTKPVDISALRCAIEDR